MRVNSVREGMSPQEVEQRLGNPTEKDVVGDYVFYEYKHPTAEDYYFIFKNGRLSKWDKGLSIADKLDIRRAEYAKVMNRYLGANIDEFVSQFGYPKNTILAPNGNTVYVFSHSTQVPLGGMFSVNTLNTKFGATTIGNVIPSQSISFYCNTFVEIGHDKKILRIRFEGNGCI